MHKHKYLYISLLITAAVILVPLSVLAVPGTINVDINDGGCVTGSGQPDPYAVVYCNIQDAIDDAASGDSINVAAGTYVEQVTITTSLTLLGAGETTTTIKAPTADRIGSVSHDGNIWDYMLAAYASTGTIDVRVEGFTFDANSENKSSTANRFAGVLLRDVSGGTAGLYTSTIQNFGTIEYENWGIVVYGNSSLTIDSNTLSDYTRDGILINGDSVGGLDDPVVTVSNNDLTGSATPLNGIQLGYGATGTVSGNIVRNHTRSSPWAAVGIIVYESTGVTVNGSNTIENCFYGLMLLTSDGNTVSGNTFNLSIAFSIGIDDSDSNTISGNTINGTLTGTEDKAIGLSNGSTGNVIGGDTLAEGNIFNMAAPTTQFPYVIYITSTVGSGSNTIKYNTNTGGTRFIQVDGGNSGTTTIENNTISGTTFAGIYLNAGSAVITGNTLTNTVRAIEFWGAANVQISNNFIDGATFDAINAGSFSGTVTVTGNSFANLPGFALHNRTATPIDASGNWWSNNTPAVITTKINGDVDYTPWLDSGTDTSSDPGFQGNFATLWVDDDSPQTGSDGRITEGVHMASGSTVYVLPGTYPGGIVFKSAFATNNLTISGDAASRPLVTGGVRMLNTADITNLTIENLVISGVSSGGNGVFDMDNAGKVSDFTLNNCVIDGSDVSGRSGFLGQSLAGTFTMTNNEFKDILGWAVMDINSGSGDGGNDYPFTTVTFANNSLHDINGSVALRGFASTLTTVVNAYGNTWDNVGGNNSEQGQHWAALEINHAVTANVYDNYVNDVIEGEWGEGEAFQFWDITTLNVYGNTITNNYQGIFIYGGGIYAVPGGSIHHNVIVGNTAYGVGVDGGATGGPLMVENNWWGCNGGPHAAPPSPPEALGCDTIAGLIDADPWLVLSVSSSPTIIFDNETSTITADLTYNSDSTDTSGSGTLEGVSISFSADIGSVDSSALTVGGQAAATFTPIVGVYDATITASLDNASVDTTVTVFGAIANTVGTYEPSVGRFKLRYSNDYGVPDVKFTFGGIVSFLPISGDWNGDGVDTIGVYDPGLGQFKLRNTNSFGPYDLKFTFGGNGDIALPLAGDWDGDGIDTIGVYIKATGKFKLRNTNDSGVPDLSFVFVGGGLTPLSGDWNSDGTDTIGVYTPAIGNFKFRNTNTPGAPDVKFRFGPKSAGWISVVGDWDGDGDDNPGLFLPDNAKWRIRYANSWGPYDLLFKFGVDLTGMLPITGNWDGTP